VPRVQCRWHDDAVFRREFIGLGLGGCVGFVAPAACRRGAAVAVDGCEPRSQSAGLANSSVSFVLLLRKCFIFREIVVSFGMNEMINYCKTISLALVL
jgi:hypothetical protein